MDFYFQRQRAAGETGVESVCVDSPYAYIDRMCISTHAVAILYTISSSRIALG